MKKVAVLIDGGCLRSAAFRAHIPYTADFIEQVALEVSAHEDLHRILYYDCAPFEGPMTLPISGRVIQKTGNAQWLSDLAQKPYFATRLGVLKFRGFELKKPGIQPTKDEDFKERYEQKGVDMRIGLDMAILAGNRSVDRITLLSNDTDCIPAMKHARISGLQVALVELPNLKITPELLAHSDFLRKLGQWPK